MYVIFVVAIVVIAGLFFLLDRGLKAVERGRRRREAGERLVAAARQAEEKDRRRRAHDEVSGALTNVLPAIAVDKDKPRNVA